MKKKYFIKIAALLAVALSATIIVWAYGWRGSAKPAIPFSAVNEIIIDDTASTVNSKAGKWIDSWAASFLSTTVMG
ncbi:MAG: hypothetical protein ABI691_25190, partial [Ginsengibacter sp.]